jgi:hypothetical protein
MKDVSLALTILTAMITPAVLILATTSLIVATSQRLGRNIDRARELSQRLIKNLFTPKVLSEKGHVYSQLNKVTRRTRLLQRAMTILYVALSIFVATSICIAVVELLNFRLAWLPLVLGIVGSGLVFYATLLLISESGIALIAVREEMNYVLDVGTKKYHSRHEEEDI